jgi:hypothetical protein
MRQTRLLILPVLGVLFFLSETYSSYRQYSHTRSTCYWWGNFVALDSKPIDKAVAFEGQKPVTECGFQEQAFDRFGVRPSIRLLVITALPAFVGSLAFVHGLGALGVNEIPVFIASTPPLIFGWYYLLGWAFERWRQRRKSRKAPPLTGEM